MRGFSVPSAVDGLVFPSSNKVPLLPNNEPLLKNNLPLWNEKRAFYAFSWFHLTVKFFGSLPTKRHLADSGSFIHITAAHLYAWQKPTNRASQGLLLFWVERGLFSTTRSRTFYNGTEKYLGRVLVKTTSGTKFLCLKLRGVPLFLRIDVKSVPFSQFFDI